MEEKKILTDEELGNVVGGKKAYDLRAYDLQAMAKGMIAGRNESLVYSHTRPNNTQWIDKNENLIDLSVEAVDVNLKNSKVKLY